ncbi:MAG: hypothetical protein IJ149_02920 [Oscillospiraceae bacterium]|nr:hypothetical protein [Oscillospiraceae bacterium]
MILRFRLYNNGSFSDTELRQLLPKLLPYGLKFADIRPVVGEFYDYLLTVEASAKYIRDHS